MKPLHQALFSTGKTLDTIKQFMNTNKQALEDIYPHDYLNEVEVELNHIKSDIDQSVFRPDSKTQFNTLQDNEKLLLLHYANQSFNQGLNEQTDPVIQFTHIARGIGILYKASEAIQHLREGTAPLTKIADEIRNPNRLSNVTGQRKADVWEQFLYNINGYVHLYVIGGQYVDEESKNNDISVLSGLAITTFDMARDEIFNKPDPNETKIEQLSQLAQDLMHFGLRYEEEIEEECVSPEYQLLHTETIRNYALGL